MKLLNIIAVMVLLTSHAAKAGSPVALEITEQRNAAAGFALTGASATRRMQQTCSAIPEAARQFDSAHQGWSLRNKPYVDAANGWMEYVKSAIAKEKGPAVAEAFIRNTYGVFSDQASMLAAELLPGSPPAVEDCLKWASILDSRAFDLDQNSEFVQELTEMRTFQERGTHGT